MFHLSHVQVGYHRRRHLLKLTTAPRVPSDRSAADRQQRKTQLADSQGAIASTRAKFSTEAQLDKVDGYERELKRLFDEAKSSGSIAAAGQVAGIQLKAIEVGSRIAQTGGYGTAHVASQPGDARGFSVNIIFSNGQREEINVIEAGSTRDAREEEDSAADRMVVDGYADEV
jgi:hypothetical protein